MKDLQKVNERQLYAFWKNFSIGLMTLVATLVLSRLFPFYFSPIIGLLAAAFLYTVLYNHKIKRDGNCMVVIYSIFYCVIVYSFVVIIINILDIWNFVKIPRELSFFNEPFIPSLILNPVCFLVLVAIYLRRNRLTICVDCKISKGLSIERGKFGEILNTETRIQLINLMTMFGILTVVEWVYYFNWYFQSTLVNNRDWYVFLGINIIVFILDELYFMSRYYNIYLDLKENGEIITEEELRDMTAKTYLRYYVICGNSVFLNRRVADVRNEGQFLIDTPFLTKRNVNGITTAEVHGIIQRLTGVRDGELRFFYGRKSLDIEKHRILRYFYFFDGKPEDYADMDIDGEWLNFETVKRIYQENPNSMSLTLLTDISRMVTVVLTQKIFDERGYRKMKIRSYQPTLSLTEIREKNYDFQDDKWIRISIYNSDIRSFQFRRWWDRLMRRDSTVKKS